MNKKYIKLNKFLILTIFLLGFLLNNQISLADETNTSTENQLTIYSNSVILEDVQTGQLLFESNADEVTYPASTTKLMTAILTLENCELSDTVTVTSSALSGIPPSYTTANLQVGEKLTVDQLLHVLLVPSANDAANVLACHISGSVQDFSDLMNSKAQELGATNTHFVNPSGIHNDNHYSTARDMCIIGRYAYKFDTIRKIASETEVSLPNLPDGTERKFKTTNNLITPSNTNYYNYATGLKTGYTDKAKSCIVATAKKDDRELICVVLGGDRIDSKHTYRDVDCIALFDYGFNNFSDKYVCEKNNNIDLTTIENVPDILKDKTVIFSDDIHMLVNKNCDLNPTVEWKNDLQLPIEKKAVVGTVTYTINGENYTVDLLSADYISPIENITIVQYVFYGLIILLILLLLKRILFRSNKKLHRKPRSNVW